MDPIGFLPDHLNLKNFLKENPVESIYDGEYDEVKVVRLMKGCYYYVFYIEIDERYKNKAAWIIQNTLKKRNLAKKCRFFYRLFIYIFEEEENSEVGMNIFINDGRGQIHHMIENEENKFSEAHN